MFLSFLLNNHILNFYKITNFVVKIEHIFYIIRNYANLKTNKHLDIVTHRAKTLQIATIILHIYRASLRGANWPLYNSYPPRI